MACLGLNIRREIYQTFRKIGNIRHVSSFHVKRSANRVAVGHLRVLHFSAGSRFAMWVRDRSFEIYGSNIPCSVLNNGEFLTDRPDRHMLLAVSWSLRHLHIALDTLGLYGVLGVSWRDLDEHAGGGSSREVPTSGTNVLKRYRTSGRLPRGSNSSSKRSSSLAAVGGKEAGTVDTTSQMR